MANEIYLMMDEKKDHILFKVGFASNMFNRIKQYTTHNPEVKCISHMITYEKTRRNIEKAFHEEVEQRGYTAIVANIDGKKTEWFAVDYNDPFAQELIEKGLTAFNCGKYRKNLGCYVLIK